MSVLIEINGVAWSPDWRHIASASYAKTVQVRRNQYEQITLLLKQHFVGLLPAENAGQYLVIKISNKGTNGQICANRC